MKTTWKRNRVFAVLIALVGVIAISPVALAAGPGSDSSPGNQIPVGELSEAETEGLLYMREEEKLARDVYLTLYEEWGMPTFRNIAAAEQTHMDAIGTLIERYGLEDPVASNDTGVFTNSTLQDLYDQLVKEGSESLASALRVGVAIEEIDILDLQEYIAQTDKADIQQVYENLTRGSRNHLRAFVSRLERETGETYEPQYLSQEAYDAIVNSPTERGGEGSDRGSKGRGSRGSSDRGSSERGSSDCGSSDRGSSDRGSSDCGSSDHGSSDHGSRGSSGRGSDNGGRRQR